jgi:UDP-N-acetylmuramoyl-tripeptide--D-alanyl-D-alanine ligase
VLSAQEGVRVLVLGDMNELGREAASLHAEMGQMARSMGIHHLLALGTVTPAAVEAFGADAAWFPNHAELLPALRELLRPGTAVLVKGSRSQHMEDILTGLDLQPAGSTEGVADAAGAG